jgi:hypothetical protein
MPYTDYYADHTTAVDILTAAGIEAPRAWVDVRARYENYLGLSTPILDRLIDGVLSGNKHDVPSLRALAFAEAIAGAGGAPAEAVRHATTKRLIEVYDGTAAYAKVSELFNTAVQRFTTIAEGIDVEGDPMKMIDKSVTDEQRQDYKSAESFATAIERLIDPLCCAAALATGDDRFRFSNALLLPALTCDLSSVHRRRFWDAFGAVNTGRTGRWGQLVAQSVPIRAAAVEDLAGLQDYRLPRPMEVIREPTRIPGEYTKRIHDPESDAVTPISPRKDDRPHGDSRAVIAG